VDRVFAAERHGPASKTDQARRRPAEHVDRALYFADQNKREKKLEEALKSVQDAETALRTSQRGQHQQHDLEVCTPSRYPGGGGSHCRALAALDTYDLHAVDEERAPAEALRNQLLFNLNASLKN